MHNSVIARSSRWRRVSLKRLDARGNEHHAHVMFNSVHVAQQMTRNSGGSGIET